jgi:tetratricopeptide (TPR) repeat protein
MSRKLLLLLAVIPLAGCAGTSAYQQCSGQGVRDPAVSIRACTTLIQSARGTEQGLATIFINRAGSYAAAGQYDRAIADLDRAIQLNPNSGAAFSLRGTVYYAEGQYEFAIKDLEQAIRLNPNDALSVRGRDIVRRALAQNLPPPTPAPPPPQPGFLARFFLALGAGL